MGRRSLAGREVDDFDPYRPTYALAVTPSRHVVDARVCCPRLGRTMISVLFPDLEWTGLLRPHAAMVESSRFCVHTSLETGRAGGCCTRRDARDVCGDHRMIEWSIANGYREIVTGTDVRFERILKRAGFFGFAHRPDEDQRRQLSRDQRNRCPGLQRNCCSDLPTCALSRKRFKLKPASKM